MLVAVRMALILVLVNMYVLIVSVGSMLVFFCGFICMSIRHWRASIAS